MKSEYEIEELINNINKKLSEIQNQKISFNDNQEIDIYSAIRNNGLNEDFYNNIKNQNINQKQKKSKKINGKIIEKK